MIYGNPADFYYKEGKVREYFQRTPTPDDPDKVTKVAGGRLNPNLKNHIKEYDTREDIIHLVKKLTSLESEKKILEKEVGSDKKEDPEYYYKLDVKGRKMYFQKDSTGKYHRIGIKAIPEEQVSSIRSNESESNSLKESIERVDIQINELKEQIKNCRGNLAEEIAKRDLRNHNIRINKPQPPKPKKEPLNDFDDFTKFFDSMFRGGRNFHYQQRNNYYSQQNNVVRPPPLTRTSLDLLVRLGIMENKFSDKESSRKRYKNWLLKNHPDRGGDSETCAKVTSAFNEVFP